MEEHTWEPTRPHKREMWMEKRKNVHWVGKMAHVVAQDQVDLFRALEHGL